MRYTSTRDGSLSVDSVTAIIRRTPENGGLFVPDALPELSFETLSGLDFAERAEKVLCAFLGDIAVGVKAALSAELDEEQLPVVKLDDKLFALELWHGKTCTAGDIARTVREFVLSRANGINSDAAVNNTVLTDEENAVAIECVAVQVAYWFSAYCDLAESGEIEPGNSIYAVAPVTCSGNIVAAWYAKKMGLPIKKIVCADENNTLYDFVRSGKFEVRESADTRILCELERLVYSLSGDNAELTAARMHELDTVGKFALYSIEPVKLRNALACEYMESEHIDEAIEYAFDEYGYLVDPVTAAALAAESRFVRMLPVVATAVAHPYTAAERVLYALGEEPQGSYKDMLDLLEDLSAMDIPEALKSKD